MTIRQIVTTSAVLLALSVPAAAQEPDPNPERADRAAAAAERAEAARQAAQERAEARAQARAQAEAERSGRGNGRGNGRGSGDGFTLVLPPLPPLPPIPAGDADAVYEAARQAIENSQYDRAIRNLDRVLTDSTKNRADAALYWKAYSQSKLDLDKEALKTVAELAKQFASSPWVKDAKALALEIQQASGQPVSVELQNDEELKLLALRSVMQSDPDKGVPIIEKMLSGGATPRVRDRALFVLAQSRSPKAHDIIANTAKNNANPELQIRAIRYLGMMRTSDYNDLMAGIYRSSTDASVKRAILQSYFQNGNADKLGELARTEKDPDLRRTAIRNLGMMNRPGTSETLIAIYKADSSIDVRLEVVNSLFIHRDAKALVDLARPEKDPTLKRDLVSKLSVMKSPEATDYMLELLR
jgi:TolA-binding protein